MIHLITTVIVYAIVIFLQLLKKANPSGPEEDKMRCLRICTVLSGILLFAVTAVSLNAAEQNKPESNPVQQYLIGSGDILEVSVWNEPDLSKTVTVRLDKRISLPLIGDVVVTGISLKDLSKILTHKFSKFISNPNVVVILLESKSKRYYLIGRVNQPGEFPLDFPLTVLQALARAGGFTEWAETKNILIIRSSDWVSGKESIQHFDYPEVIKGKNLQQNIKILPGDTIVVP